jgi:hypothetical protein
MQCGSWFPFAPATLLPRHLPVSSVHERVGGGMHPPPCLPSTISLPSHHWPVVPSPLGYSVSFAVCLVVEMMHVPVLEFTLEVH